MFHFIEIRRFNGTLQGYDGVSVEEENGPTEQTKRLGGLESTSLG
jgi:hypothetical protein